MSIDSPDSTRSGSLTIYCFRDTLAGENCYVLVPEGASDVCVFDPGFQTDAVYAWLDDLHLRTEIVALTHAHPDHCFGLPLLRKKYDSRIAYHSADKPLLAVDWSSRGFPWDAAASYKATEDLATSTSLTWTGGTVDVHPTPGHTPGSVCFAWNGLVFTGDTLLRRGVGRTDLPLGSWVELERSVRTVLYTLPGEYAVYPGHGDRTTIAEEKEENPFLQQS